MCGWGREEGKRKPYAGGQLYIRMPKIKSNRGCMVDAEVYLSRNIGM